MKYVGDLKKQLETLGGKEYSDKDIPSSLENTWSLYQNSAKKTQEDFIDAENELSKYALKTRGEDGKESWVVQPSRGDTVRDEDKNAFKKAKREYDFAKGRAEQTGLRFQNFTKDNNLFYPEITTAQQQKELDRQSEARTSWFNENESYINQDPANADIFMKLQESVSNRKSDDEFMAMLNEELGETGGIPEAWLEPATEDFVETKPTDDSGGITDKEVDIVLADVREKTGFYPEGDAPKDKPEIPAKIPSILEPLTARGDAESEVVVKAKEKEAEGVELIPKPLVETGKYNVSDIAKSGDETGKVRRYISKSFGENLKQLKELRERVPGLEKRGDSYNLKQIVSKISNIEDKIRKSIGGYINPDTGQFSNSQYNKRIYGKLKEIFPDMQMGEIMNLVRGLSTAKPYSKKKKKAFTSS